MKKSELCLKFMEIAAHLVRTEVEQNKFIHESGSYDEQEASVKKLFDSHLEFVEKKFFQLMNK